jgi:hypothetical protein
MSIIKEKRMQKLLSFLVLLLIPVAVHPCTNAIVSGKVTADGRPLLWKNRDTNNFQNKIIYFDDGRYSYFGLVNADDAEGKEVWVGMNAAGFAIMNSASYNLKAPDDTTTMRDREGIVMKLALQQCATLEDFENLLRDLPKPLGVEANFGVIDARGGAALYETGNFTFRKFDVNDPDVAPNGYLVSTNFSISGDPERGHGYIRYETADALFDAQVGSGGLSAGFILTDVARSLKHSRTGMDLREYELLPAGTLQYAYFRDFIPRYTSTGSIVVRGVMPGESPWYATMFTILGFPLTSVTVPLWLAGGDAFPGFLKADKTDVAPLCDAALRLKSMCFPIARGSGRDYIDVNMLFTREETGVLQLLPNLETRIFMREEEFFNSALETGVDREKVGDFYSEVEEMVTDFYRDMFGMMLD